VVFAGKGQAKRKRFWLTRRLRTERILPESRGRRRLGELIKATLAGAQWGRLCLVIGTALQHPPPAPRSASRDPGGTPAGVAAHVGRVLRRRETTFESLTPAGDDVGEIRSRASARFLHIASR
jgi:hypothetical protein